MYFSGLNVSVVEAQNRIAYLAAGSLVRKTESGGTVFLFQGKLQFDTSNADNVTGLELAGQCLDFVAVDQG